MSSIKYGTYGFIGGIVVFLFLFWLSGSPLERSPETVVAVIMGLLLGVAGMFFGFLIGEMLKTSSRGH